MEHLSDTLTSPSVSHKSGTVPVGRVGTGVIKPGMVVKLKSVEMHLVTMLVSTLRMLLSSVSYVARKILLPTLPQSHYNKPPTLDRLEMDMPPVLDCHTTKIDRRSGKEPKFLKNCDACWVRENDSYQANIGGGDFL